MNVIMSKYEYLVMRCAVQQKEPFDAKGLYHALCNAGITKLSESGAVIILNRLVKKQLIQKCYIRERFRIRPLYRTCYNADEFSAHAAELDISNALHKKVWEEERRRRSKRERGLLYRYLHAGSLYITEARFESWEGKYIFLYDN